jgi:hypothetical protein
VTKKINPWVAVAILLGLLQVWFARFAITGDGISYLDMGQAYLRGDWHTAVNGYWNPLYAWFQAAGFAIFRPSPYWEYPVVHLVDFSIYVLTVFAFEFFLVALVRGREDETAMRFVAYALFTWTTLQLIGTSAVNPDMIVALTIYAAFGILARMANGYRTALGLALALAAGYYAKAAELPVALLIFAAALVFMPCRRQVLVSLALFLMMCSPLIVVLSHKTGHLTIGDTGRLNYAWYVNGIDSRLWQGYPSGSGTPLHPARIILRSPKVYEFDHVFPVSNPIWYDESYWYEGLVVHLEARTLYHAVRGNLYAIVKLLAIQGSGFLLGGLLALLVLRLRPVGLPAPEFLAAWVASVASIVMLCAVHVETRFIAAFVTVIFLVPFALLRIPRTPFAVVVAVLGLASAMCFWHQRPRLGSSAKPFDSTPVNEQQVLAAGMESFGLAPGDKYATVCCDGSASMKWGHLVHMHLVACFDWDDQFWRLNERDQERVLAALATTGAKAAISEIPPPDPDHAHGWQRVGRTKYYIRALPGERRF